MARSVDQPDSGQKRQAPPPVDWRRFLPPPAPRGKNWYDPVPVIPDEPDPIIPAPIEVDPPSRPHLITGAPTYSPSFELPLTQSVPPDSLNSMSEFARRPSGGLLGMLERAGVFEFSAPHGLVALLQEYLSGNRKRSDTQAARAS